MIKLRKMKTIKLPKEDEDDKIEVPNNKIHSCITHFSVIQNYFYLSKLVFIYPYLFCIHPGLIFANQFCSSRTDFCKPVLQRNLSLIKTTLLESKVLCSYKFYICTSKGGGQMGARNLGAQQHIFCSNLKRVFK